MRIIAASLLVFLFCVNTFAMNFSTKTLGGQPIADETIRGTPHVLVLAQSKKDQDKAVDWAERLQHSLGSDVRVVGVFASNSMAKEFKMKRGKISVLVLNAQTKVISKLDGPPTADKIEKIKNTLLTATPASDI